MYSLDVAQDLRPSEEHVDVDLAAGTSRGRAGRTLDLLHHIRAQDAGHGRLTAIIPRGIDAARHGIPLRLGGERGGPSGCGSSLRGMDGFDGGIRLEESPLMRLGISNQRRNVVRAQKGIRKETRLGEP